MSGQAFKHWRVPSLSGHEGRRGSTMVRFVEIGSKSGQALKHWRMPFLGSHESWRGSTIVRFVEIGSMFGQALERADMPFLGSHVGWRGSIRESGTARVLLRSAPCFAKLSRACVCPRNAAACVGVYPSGSA
eukprot:m.524407 g.524407  ORF g.524407 m.524407 type:complete len:132 (+) comp57528_c0_seq64:1402-1797(+)